MITAKFITTASSADDPLKLARATWNDPAATVVTPQRYSPGVPPDCILSTIVSVAATVELVTVKLTSAPAPRAASSIVITPVGVFKVTPVLLLVA